MLSRRLFAIPALIVGFSVSAMMQGQTPPPRQGTPPPGQGQTNPATGQKERPQTPANVGADTKFIAEAYKDGQTEIAISDLAATKSQNAEVKSLAATIKSDHEQANQELKSLATRKSVTLPGGAAPTGTPPPTAGQKGGEPRTGEQRSGDQGGADRSMVNKFEKLSGASFDRTYLQTMVTDHRQAINEFERAAKSSDTDVKAFAEKCLPKLREHLQRSQELQKSSK